MTPAQQNYTWNPPRARQQEEWLFYDHTRNGKTGQIVRGVVRTVETHYDKSGRAYHIFHMQVSGWVRRRVVGEEQLVGQTS